MTMKMNNKQKGFSLIEAIIYTAIFSTFIMGFSAFINNLRSERLHTQSMIEIHDQGTRLIHIITGTVRNARTINAPGTGQNGTILSVTTVDPATDPTIFSVTSGGVLTMKEGTGATIPLTNNKVSVSNLSFENFSQAATPGVIKIRFTLGNGAESQRSQEKYSLDFYGSAAIR